MNFLSTFLNSSELFIKNINTTTLLLVLLILVIIILILLLYKKTRKDRLFKKIDKVYLQLREDIKFAVDPKLLNVSIELSSIIDLAVEIWRMEQRILKSAALLPETQLKGLENSVQKLKRYIEKYDIEILDYKNQKYNEGYNFDVLSVEKDESVFEPTIKETIEPTIMCKGQVVRKAKIILINNL
jgi:molecular chaperone GrpE (heat shock protein)